MDRNPPIKNKKKTMMIDSNKEFKCQMGIVVVDDCTIIFSQIKPEF